MTEGNYTLRWRGQDTGPFSTEQIRSMWENGEISGAHQVYTANGWLTVQDFTLQMDAAAEHERMVQEQERAAKAESDRRQLEQMQLAQQREHLLQQETEKREAEQREKEIQENQLTGKKYYLYLEGQKKGPFAADSVRVMVNAGKADPETLVWTHEIGDWLALKGYKELLSQPASQIQSTSRKRRIINSGSAPPNQRTLQNYRPMLPHDEKDFRKIGPSIAGALLIISFFLPIPIPSLGNTKYIFFTDILSDANGKGITIIILPLILGIFSLIILNTATIPARGIALLSATVIFIVLELSLIESSSRTDQFGKLFSDIVVNFIPLTVIKTGLRCRYYRPEKAYPYLMCCIGAGLWVIMMLTPSFMGNDIRIVEIFELLERSVSQGIIEIIHVVCAITAFSIACSLHNGKPHESVSKGANISFNLYLYAVILCTSLSMAVMFLEMDLGSKTIDFMLLMLKYLLTVLPAVFFLPMSLSDILLGEPGS